MKDQSVPAISQWYGSGHQVAVCGTFWSRAMHFGLASIAGMYMLHMHNGTWTDSGWSHGSLQDDCAKRPLVGT